MKTKAQSTNAPLPATNFKWKVTRSGALPYLFYLPKDYNAKSREKWPLMLFLHGAGERGADVQRAAIHGPMKLVRQGTNFPFIIVAPLCPAGQIWDNDALLQLLDHATKKFAVDTNRVYLTGLSMGGYGVWSLGLSNPERFAAIAPICGGGEFITPYLAEGDQAKALKTLGVWAFHGAKDASVPLEESQRMVGLLKKVEVEEVKLTIYPEAQHDSWSETYQNPELYEWLLKHRRTSKRAGK